jgi:hypothetical protein
LGHTEAQATADAATQRTVVELSDVILDQGNKVGVVKVKFGLSVVDSVLAQGSAERRTFRVDLVDNAGKVIASSVPSTRFKPFPGFEAVLLHEGRGELRVSVGFDRAARVGVDVERWPLASHRACERSGRHADVLHRPLGAAGRDRRDSRFDHRFTRRYRSLYRAAESLVRRSGSRSRRKRSPRETFPKRSTKSAGDDEIGRLARAVSAMIEELRRLAMALQESATETVTMTSEITASSEEMAASAGQIAHTASDLSQQANTMAGTIQALAGSSESLVGVASSSMPARAMASIRNAKLRVLAVENRARLDDSSRSLAALTGDVEASAAAIDQLARASEEVRSFVTLVQKLARQSKLLALNAAMEAARAGRPRAWLRSCRRRSATTGCDVVRRGGTNGARCEWRVAGDRRVADVERANGRDRARRSRRDRGRVAVIRPDRASRSPKRTRGRRRSRLP